MRRGAKKLVRTKQCHSCSKRYVPTGNTILQTCPHCNKETMTRHARTTQIQSLVDDLFSVLVRYSAADGDGMVSCVTCNHRMEWEHSVAGHFVKREFKAVRWDMENVHPQCYRCNGQHGRGEEWEHGLYIDRTYGNGRALEIKTESKLPNPTRGAMVDMARVFHGQLLEFGLESCVAKILDRNRIAAIEGFELTAERKGK